MLADAGSNKDKYAVAFKYQKGDAAADASVIDSYNLTETEVKAMASSRFKSGSTSVQEELWLSGGLNAALNGDTLVFDVNTSVPSGTEHHQNRIRPYVDE